MRRAPAARLRTVRWHRRSEREGGVRYVVMLDAPPSLAARGWGGRRLWMYVGVTAVQRRFPPAGMVQAGQRPALPGSAPTSFPIMWPTC
jgi:hypothetical protein